MDNKLNLNDGGISERQGIVVTILGTRGSVPVFGDSYSVFGGATSCIKVVALGTADGSANDEEIYLDAGSGIVQTEIKPDSHISILFSHMHLDHLIGLPFFIGLSQKGRKIDLYGVPRDGLTIEESMVRAFSPPFWPLKITDYPADTKMHALPEAFDIGKLHVETKEVNHPGGCTSIKISLGDKSMVYLTDFEHTGADLEGVKSFIKDTDLLIYDGQYTEDEYKVCKGFGHSVPEFGVGFAGEAGAKRVIFTHHAPNHDDAFLSSWEERLKKDFESASFARGGETIIL